MADAELYKYQNLDPKYRKIAESELNESSEMVQAHIASLRRWLQQCAHIENCPTDDRFLLQFLRVAKFNQEKAQARLENFCTIRGSKERGLPHLFKPVPLDDVRIEKILRMGMQMPLGYNERGELLVLVKLGAFNPDVMDIEEARPIMMMCVEAIIGDERSSIAGCHVIFDFEGMSGQKMDMIFNRKMAKENARIYQDAFAMRQKGYYYYHEPLLFDIIFKMMTLWLAPKLVRRIHRVKDDVKKIHERCPGARELLPKEYGGQAGPISEVTERWIKQFYTFWAQRPARELLLVDEKKRPPDSIKYLKQYADFQGECFGGTQGTYTKIDAL